LDMDAIHLCAHRRPSFHSVVTLSAQSRWNIPHCIARLPSSHCCRANRCIPCCVM